MGHLGLPSEDLVRGFDGVVHEHKVEGSEGLELLEHHQLVMERRFRKNELNA